MATYNVMQCDNAAIIKYKIKHSLIVSRYVLGPDASGLRQRYTQRHH